MKRIWGRGSNSLPLNRCAIKMKLPFEKARKILVKQNVRVSKLQKRAAKQLFQAGIINLDKPKGPKSIHCVNKIREILELPKGGHCGTLDPLVTGVLPVVLGKAVKLSETLSTSGKIYEGEMKLRKEVTKAEVLKAFKKFTGKISQLPPRLSAVKREIREREIYWLKLKKFDGKTIAFNVGCQHGTYIRKLCHDIAEHLKVGGYMTKLRRIQAGPFKIKDSVSLDKVRKNYSKFLETKSDNLIREIILPPEAAIKWLGKVWIDDEVLPRLLHGSPVFAPGIIQLTSGIKIGDSVAILNQSSELVGLGKAEMSSEEMLKAEKGLSVKTEFVFL